MPEASPPTVFAKACQTKQSKTTKAFDDFFKKPRSVTHPIFVDADKLKKSKVFDNPLAPWARSELTARGVVKTREFNHINKWPKAQKERVRKALLHAINNDVKVEFFWELYGGSTEITTITPDPLPTSGTIKITFVSPQKRIRASAGEIIVDVG